MSKKLLVAIVAVAGLLFLGTAVYAHGSGMGWGYGGHMSSGFGWGHHMGNGYGYHMGYNYQQNNNMRYQQDRGDNGAYCGYHRSPGYHHARMPYGWNNNNAW